MNQIELINTIADYLGNTGRTKADIKFVLDALGVVAQAELQQGGEVTLPGIGKLSVKPRAARQGRNPKTGEAVQIAACNVPHFSAAKALKEAVNS